MESLSLPRQPSASPNDCRSLRKWWKVKVYRVEGTRSSRADTYVEHRSSSNRRCIGTDDTQNEIKIARFLTTFMLALCFLSLFFVLPHESCPESIVSIFSSANIYFKKAQGNSSRSAKSRVCVNGEIYFRRAQAKARCPWNKYLSGEYDRGVIFWATIVYVCIMSSLSQTLSFSFLHRA